MICRISSVAVLAFPDLLHLGLDLNLVTKCRIYELISRPRWWEISCLILSKSRDCLQMIDITIRPFHAVKLQLDLPKANAYSPDQWNAYLHDLSGTYLKDQQEWAFTIFGTRRTNHKPLNRFAHIRSLENAHKRHGRPESRKTKLSKTSQANRLLELVSSNLQLMQGIVSNSLLMFERPPKSEPRWRPI